MDDKVQQAEPHEANVATAALKQEVAAMILRVREASDFSTERSSKNALREAGLLLGKVGDLALAGMIATRSAADWEAIAMQYRACLETLARNDESANRVSGNTVSVANALKLPLPAPAPRVTA